MKLGSIGGYSDCMPHLGLESGIVLEGHRRGTSMRHQAGLAGGSQVTAAQVEQGLARGFEPGAGKGQPAAASQFGFEIKVSLGLHWLRLIEAGDAQAVAVRDRMLRQCTDFTRETLCSAFASKDKAEIIRAHQLGMIVLRNRNHPALRTLFKRLSGKATFEA